MYWGYSALLLTLSVHDVYVRHRDNSFLTKLAENNFIPIFVPANRTDDLQWHDVYYNKLHKGGVRTRFDEKYVSLTFQFLDVLFWLLFLTRKDAWKYWLARWTTMPIVRQRWISAWVLLSLGSWNFPPPQWKKFRRMLLGTTIELSLRLLDSDKMRWTMTKVVTFIGRFDIRICITVRS